ncbi:uncharacterized protein [Drosophila virilis]|uniref:Uncharacterized protein, isoform G n=1 Tax=Drosophila virilis TaxID=7244 RepID=A0A0Q9W4X4_DROVI|nr:uncharacterized protein LOC6625339 isoform X3 [Drosophila virilis]KRF80108.1 uncharacterized protein Dvir_GJ20211, isoform G [Drosophila virilis]
MNWCTQFGLHVAVYLALVFFFFCCLPIVCFYVRIENRTLAKICPPRCQRRQRQINRSRNDRQNNVELGRQHNRFGDIFYIEPNSQEAARIREQLEKDDKELPSYDEVMRMCNLTTPTAAAALPTPTMESSAIGIAALPAPPYSECDPHLNVETPAATNAVTASTLEPSPSTSRAAQIPT